VSDDQEEYFEEYDSELELASELRESEH